MKIAVLGIRSFRAHPFVEAVTRITSVAEEVHGVRPHLPESSGCFEKERSPDAPAMVGSKDIDLAEVALVCQRIWIGSRFDASEPHKGTAFILDDERRVVGRILAQNRGPLLLAKRDWRSASMSFAKGPDVLLSKLRGVSENRIAEPVRHARIMPTSRLS